MILLDTHVLLWWALDPNQLSPLAAQKLIVATALVKGVPLLTKDEAIRAYPAIETLW